MCPPGVDQTTRSPQSWQVLAPEKRQVLPTRDNYFHQFSIFKDDEKAVAKFQDKLWGMLARPAHATSTGSGLPSTQGQTCGYLSLLSNEIFDMVFEHLESKNDIMALALTSTSIWRLVLHHIKTTYLAAAAPWANTRLIFQGSYSEDLPKALTDDGDLVKNIVTPSPYSRMYNRRVDARVFYNSVAAIVRTPTVGELAKDFGEAMQNHRENSGVGKRDWEVLENDIKYREREKAKNEWILKNLTTREIVRSEIVKEEDAEVSLEAILLKQIRWTSMLGGLRQDMSPWRGKWAGHRFEIVTKGAHEREGGEWEDVSVGAAKSWNEKRALVAW